MNPLQKLLWFFVFLAGLATAAAGIRVLTDPLPPILVLGEPVFPPSGVRVAILDHTDCAGPCADTRRALEDMKRSAAPEIETVILQASGSDEAIEALYALAGPPKPDASSGEIVLPIISNIGDWTLTAENGKPFGSADVAGKIWIADFIFTRCAGACPAMCEGMEAVIAKLPNDPRLRFVSFSVDPQHDTPAVLTEYAAKWKGDKEKWRFVTGQWVYKLAYEGFKVEEARPNPDPSAGNEFIHGQRFYVIDGRGRMRAGYTYDFQAPETTAATVDSVVRGAKALLETPEKVVDHVHDRRFFLVDQQGRLRGVYPSRDGALERNARRLALTPAKILSVRSLPALNAALNFTSFVFLSAGLAFILNRRITLHKVAMTTALVTSIVFLASYVTYHLNVGSVKYAGEGWMRSAYFGILISHTILAAAVAPLALVTVIRAWRGKFDRHVAIARWTLPVWMYVSLTGILVYLMLYWLT